MKIDFNAIISFLQEWFQFFACFIKTLVTSTLAKDMEILALRSQLSIIQQEILNQKIQKPRFTPASRQLWVLLSQILPDWQSTLFIVKPETVAAWHNKAFKVFWKLKSRKPGRPKISPGTIALIKWISKENPLLSPEKIHDRLVALGIADAPAPNTISKYLPSTRKTPSEKQIQSWKTFLANHSKQIWAMDFLVVPTLYFNILYVLIILSHARRKIEHFAFTTNPTSDWVAQNIREATPYDNVPKYLIHDNDCIFTSQALQKFLANVNIKSKKTAFHAPWQNGYCERVIGTLRRELLNHVIPRNKRHLEYLLREYIFRYYNTVRTHQGIHCQTPIMSEILPETLADKSVLISEPILGGLYHSYKKIA